MGAKTQLLIAFAVFSFLSGAADQYFYPGQEYPPSALPSMLISIFLIFYWYRLDSDEIGYRRSVWLNVGVIAIAVLALPYYFFRTRGTRGFAATALFLLALVASGLLTALGSIATALVVAI